MFKSKAIFSMNAECWMLSLTEKPILPDKLLISKHRNKPKKLQNAEVSDEPIISFSLFTVGIFPLKSNQVFPVLTYMAQKPKFCGGLVTVSHCQPPLVYLLVSRTKHMLSANLRPCSNNYNNNLAPAQLSCTSRSLQERNTKHFQPAFHAIRMMSFIYKPPCIPVLLPRAPGCRHSNNMLAARTPHQHEVTHPLAIHLPCYEPCDS